MVGNGSFFAVPSPPWNVTAMQLNARQVLVSWQAPRSPNGTIVSYVVFQTPPVPPIQNLQNGSKTHFIMNDDYSANKNYSFWVSDFQVSMWVHLMFVDLCIIVQFIKNYPTRCNNVSKF
jgi:hypothetical protein